MSKVYLLLNVDEFTQSMLYLIDSISSNVKIQDEVSLFKLNSYFRLFNSRKLQSKYIESNLYNKVMRLENENLKEDVYQIISSLLDSSLTIDNKKNLIKMTFNKLFEKDGSINFSGIKSSFIYHVLRIVAISNKILPEVVTREVALSAIEVLKQTYNNLNKYNQYQFLCILVQFNPKLIDENLKEFLSANLRV
jgi:hypothetical protein